MTTHTELYSMQILQEANTIVKYLTRVVDDTEVFYGGIITRFEVLDSTVGLDEIHATRSDSDELISICCCKIEILVRPLPIF